MLTSVLQMPSTRKQKAKARRLRTRYDVRQSDIGNVDFMLGNHDLISWDRKIETSINGSTGPSDDRENSTQSQKERSSQDNE